MSDCKCGRLFAGDVELCSECADEEITRLRARVEELEHELNPDPEAHLMGWEGDDE